jgi:lipopolysaccharide export system protein LptA
MKTILILSLAVCAAASWAQPSSVLPKIVPGQKTEIWSKTGFYDNNTREQVFLGEVRVVDPKIKLTCEQLTVNVPEPGQRLSRLTAETNVVIDFVDEKSKDQKYHVTAAMAVYSYSVVNSVTNETVTFTGLPGKPPLVDTAQGTISSEPLVWDRAAGRFVFKDYHMQLNQSLTDTNGPSPLKL